MDQSRQSFPNLPDGLYSEGKESDRLWTAEMVHAAIQSAVDVEREACAKIAETTRTVEDYCVGRDLLTVPNAEATKRRIAESIRARKAKP